jgi:hypothetical protein
MKNSKKGNTNLTDILGIYIQRWKDIKDEYQVFNQQFSITNPEPLRLDKHTLSKLYTQLKARAELVEDYSRSRRKLRGKISVSKEELWALLNDDMASSFKKVEESDSSLPYVHLAQAGSTKSKKIPRLEKPHTI